MTNTRSEKMKPKNVIAWVLCLSIVALFLSSGIQAQELTEVNATDILEKIENGENIFLENARIKGELNLSKIELKTSPIARSKEEIMYYGLEEELKIVESKIKIHDSVFEDDVDFSNTQFRKDIDFTKTAFLGDIVFKDASFSGDADFIGADFCGDAYFRDASFSGDAYFGRASFSGDAYFIGADFGGNASFYLTEFNKVSFTRSTFTNVSLDESDFNRMNVEWYSLEDALVFDGPTYIKLIRNRDQFLPGHNISTQTIRNKS